MHNRLQRYRRKGHGGRRGGRDGIKETSSGDAGMVHAGTGQGHGGGRPAGRRSRHPAGRVRRVEFTLTDEEFGDLDTAAARAGLARGAYAAQAALATARGSGGQTSAPLREALAELIRSAGLVRRIGVNLNQAVAKLNAT